MLPVCLLRGRQQDVFLRFGNAVINDLIYLLDESISKATYVPVSSYAVRAHLMVSFHASDCTVL